MTGKTGNMTEKTDESATCPMGFWFIGSGLKLRGDRADIVANLIARGVISSDAEIVETAPPPSSCTIVPTLRLRRDTEPPPGFTLSEEKLEGERARVAGTSSLWRWHEGAAYNVWTWRQGAVDDAWGRYNSRRARSAFLPPRHADVERTLREQADLLGIFILENFSDGMVDSDALAPSCSAEKPGGEGACDAAIRLLQLAKERGAFSGGTFPKPDVVRTVAAKRLKSFWLRDMALGIDTFTVMARDERLVEMLRPELKQAGWNVHTEPSGTLLMVRLSEIGR